MSIFLGIGIVLLSLTLSTLFVVRDAKSFASQPPTPLVDLDRLYDWVFSRMDENSGSQITPKELSIVLSSFIAIFSRHGLIRDTIVPNSGEDINETITSEIVVAEIVTENKELEIPVSVISDVVILSFAYLRDINAVT